MVSEDGVSSTGVRTPQWQESEEDCRDWCLSDPDCQGVEWEDGGSLCYGIQQADSTVAAPGTIRRRIKHTWNPGE